MYNCTIDFQTLLQLNNALKEEGYKATIHSVNGCSHDTVELRDLDLNERDKIVDFINKALKCKYLTLEEVSKGSTSFRVRSTFKS